MTDPRVLEKDQTFATYDLDPRLSRALAMLKYTHPTQVQAQAIPAALAGKDILARARTGSGKTVAYTLPIIQKLLQTENKASMQPDLCFTQVAHPHFLGYLDQGLDSRAYARVSGPSDEAYPKDDHLQQRCHSCCKLGRSAFASAAATHARREAGYPGFYPEPDSCSFGSQGQHAT